MKKMLKEKNKGRWKFAVPLIVTLVALSLLIFYDYALNQSEDEMHRLIEKYCPEGVLVFGGDEDSAPMRFLDSDGVYQGFTVDYLSLMSMELGIQINTVHYEKWNDALEACKTGETDLCDIYESTEREKLYALSEPLYTMRAIIAVDKNSEYENKDVSSMKIGALDGDYAVGFLERKYPDIEIEPLKNLPQGLRYLSEGKIDGLIGDEPILMYYINKYEYSGKVRLLDKEIYVENMVLAMPKSKAALIPAINAAIKKVNNGEQLEKIQQKWFGISTSLIVDTRDRLINLFLIVTITIGVSAMLLYYYSRKLKRAVNQRTNELELSRNELGLILKQIPEKVFLLDSNGVLSNEAYSSNPAEYIVSEGKCFLYQNGICGNAICDGKCAGIEANCLVNDINDGHNILSSKFERKNSVFQITLVKANIKSNDSGISNGDIDSSEDEYNILATIRDITLDEINSKKILQTSKMVAIGQLAAGMAHQIKNPLGVIRLQSFMMKKTQDEEKREKALEYIDESVQDITSTIDNVLNYWRISGDKVELINARGFLQGIISIYAVAAEKNGVATVLDCDETLEINAIRESLTHVIGNLVSNAIDAMQSGGRLIVSAKAEEKWVVIKCSDSGTGIRKEDMENLFNPFFTTKEQGKGTGLGLFVAYSECEKLGGNIDVESKIGEGTTFTVSLPRL